MAAQSDLDRVYLKMAEDLSTLSHAKRRKVGCLIVKDTQIIFPEPVKAKEIELNDDAASTYLDLIYTADEQIKALSKAKENAQIKVQELMGDAEIGFNKNYQVKWGSTTYKAQPEKIVPAKEARTVRNKTLRIKKIEHEE